MDPLIDNLDDAGATRIVAAIARSRLHSGAQELPWDSGLRHTLATSLDLSPEIASSSEGDLARQALLLAAEDPKIRKSIAAMAEHGVQSKDRFDAGATIALTTAVLVVLQSHLRFERDKNGAWSVIIEKKPTSDSILKSLLKKLLALPHLSAQRSHDDSSL